MSRLLSVVLVGSAAAFTAPALNAQAALPSGREVIDRYIEAIGGRDAIMQQSGRHAYGSFSVPAQGMGGRLELYAQPPNKMLARITLEGIGEILSGYDGSTAWSMNPMMGPMVLDSVQLYQTRQQADFYSDLYRDDYIRSLETVSREPFAAADSAEVYKVKVTTVWGEEYHEFFDTQSGLRVGALRSQASPMGNVDVVTVVSDWRVVEGMKVAFKSEQRTMGVVNLITMDSVLVMNVPDSVFALPPAVQALITK